MNYVEVFDMLTTWNDMVDLERTARLIDAFVNSLNLADYGIKKRTAEGRTPYDPKSLLKNYIYGSDNGIKYSRKLAKSYRANVEVKWMLGGVEPDFRTISYFRKDNIDSFKNIFHEFNRRVSDVVEWGFTSFDGSKFFACNSKSNNFTKNKLDDRIEWLNGHIEENFRILDESDKQEDFEEVPDKLTKELVDEKLKETRECLEDGIIPHIITDDGKDGYKMEMPYEKADDVDAESTEPDELRKALHAGVISEAYKDVISGIEIKEVRRKVSDELEADEPAEAIYGTKE